MASNENRNNDSSDRKIIICSNCGEENFPEDIFCISCGVKLKGNPKVIDNNPLKSEKITEEKKETRGRNYKVKAAKNKKKQIKKGETASKINPVKLFYFILFLGVLAVINLLIAGVFDEPKANFTQSSDFDKIHSGIDMEQETKINDLREQVKNNPNDSELILSLAHILNDNGHELEAIQRYNDYLKINPDNANVIVDLGVCYFDMQEYDKAKEKMMEAIKIEPDHQIAHFNMGIINSATGNMAEAKKWWQKVIEINPNTSIAEKAKEFINSN